MTMRERLENVVLGFHPKSYHGYNWDRSRISEFIDAILAEMETPSVAVIDAAYKAEKQYDDGTIDAWCGLSSAFRAMIRAIREGK